LRPFVAFSGVFYDSFTSISPSGYFIVKISPFSAYTFNLISYQVSENYDFPFVIDLIDSTTEY